MKPRLLRIKEEVERVPGAYLWITDAKEIENYVPGQVWTSVYSVPDVPSPKCYDAFPTNPSKGNYVQKYLQRRTFDKCEFAMKAVKVIRRSDMCGRFDLEVKMKTLVETIKKWNQ